MFEPMPIYEYRCVNCKRRFEKSIAYQDYGVIQVVCPGCSSTNVTRLISRVRVTRNSRQHLAELANPENLDKLEDDPQTLGRMMKEMKSEVGEEMGGEFDEVVDRLERGQSPDEIDQAFPDLGTD